MSVEWKCDKCQKAVKTKDRTTAYIPVGWEALILSQHNNEDMDLDNHESIIEICHLCEECAKKFNNINQPRPFIGYPT